MNCKQFHEFHEIQTNQYLHNTSRGDVMSEYNYIELSTRTGGVVAFIPTNINPDFFQQRNAIDTILEKEFEALTM